MTLVETALKIAVEAHAGQTDKAGAPYVLHPIRLMQKMDSESMQAAALLHDVLEDSDFTANDLREAGIPDEVVALVVALSKRPEEEDDYEAFIERIAGNPRAARIKLADLEDNMDVPRIAELTDRDLKRVAKYHKAWHRLKAALDEAENGGTRRVGPSEVTGDERIFQRGYIPMAFVKKMR